jgi:hypothetical protein
MRLRFLALIAVAITAAALTACGGGGKTYDIGPIFPLTANKCAKYHGEEGGSGITETCMVSKDECERAAADWTEAMEGGGVEAVEFSCE